MVGGRPGRTHHMARTIESTGRTVAQATSEALRELGISREDAEIDVVQSGKKGFLGIFGGTPAMVRVTHRPSTGKQAEEVVTNMLRLMQISNQLHVTETKKSLVLDIETAGSDGLLIGKGGQTLSALEYLVNRILQRRGRRSPRVVLDVSGYKRQREDFLKNKALSLADEVKSAGQKVTTEPLDAADRKIVHETLRSDPAIETKSVGHGRVKSVVLSPASKKSKKRGGRKRPRRRRRKK
ncbi:MAG: KH domain-containing protein [Candidatus Eisenbacteria bacterium]|nr:KH domain-containing protein [Candidatus Eisenbacteria bacterium]